MIAAKPKSDMAPMMSVFRKLHLILSPRRKDERKERRGGRSSLSVNPVSGVSQVSLRSVFSYFDVNGDGKITPEELQTCVKMVSGEELRAEDAEAAMNALDSDGDGMLGFDEFEELMEGSSRGEEERERERELKEAFQMFVIKGSGGITASGLKKMLRRLGEVWCIEDCRLMIREFDLDGNGVVTFDEFLAMMR